jgi:hypothetical protein
MFGAVYIRAGKTTAEAPFICTPTQMASLENFSAMDSVFIYLFIYLTIQKLSALSDPHGKWTGG